MTKLLVVEDDDDLREIIRRELTIEGYSVETARHGGEGLDVLARGDLPALILLDLMMPVVNGWVFRDRQLADARIASIPVVVMTAAGGNEATIDATALVRKPIDIERLLAVVQKYAPLSEFHSAPATVKTAAIQVPKSEDDNTKS